ncbi:MAG: cell division protein FtsL [Hyphomicrobiaceae bacterium]|jgi:cell division protein FtsL
MQRLIRSLAATSVIAALVVAVALYAIKQETRAMAVEVDRLESQINRERAAIVLLKAELANRAGPDRIARLAREHLDMRPITPGQLGQIDALPWRPGARVAAQATSQAD